MAAIGTGQELLVQGRMSQTKQLETIRSAGLNITVIHSLMHVFPRTQVHTPSLVHEGWTQGLHT